MKSTNGTSHLARTVRLGVFCVAGMMATAVIPTAQAPVAPAQPDMTFTKDVAPILQRACQNCHRPGSIAPMSLLTYEEVRPWARSIKQKVADREMPPWYIDRHVGITKFNPDPSLTDAEVKTILKWVDSGAAKGDPADMPPPKTFTADDRWAIGTPDIVSTLAKDIVVKPEQADQWLNIPMEDLGLTQDRYIKAVEIKPIKGVKTTHHADALMAEPDDEDASGFLVEYAVGKGGDIFPEGTGRLIKAGTRLVMNVHLHAIGVETPMNVAVGMKLYPVGYVPKHVEITQHIGDTEDLDIAPGDNNVRSDGYTVLTKPTRLTSFQPHLHSRGKAQCLEAIFPPSAENRKPAARTETISCVNRYKFAWHIVYHYAEDAQPILPAGTILHVISWHDNSSGNKFNPDPTNWVGFGQRTIDDMSFAWMSFYYLTDEEYAQALAEREAKKRMTTEHAQ
jgi:hypothetical protein